MQMVQKSRSRSPSPEPTRITHTKTVLKAAPELKAAPAPVQKEKVTVTPSDASLNWFAEHTSVSFSDWFSATATPSHHQPLQQTTVMEKVKSKQDEFLKEMDSFYENELLPLSNRISESSRSHDQKIEFWELQLEVLSLKQKLLNNTSDHELFDLRKVLFTSLQVAIRNISKDLETEEKPVKVAKVSTPPKSETQEASYDATPLYPTVSQLESPRDPYAPSAPPLPVASLYPTASEAEPQKTEIKTVYTREEMVKIKKELCLSEQLNLKSDCTTEQVQGLLSFIDLVQALVNKKQVTTSRFDPNKRSQAIPMLIKKLKDIGALAFLSGSADDEAIKDFLLKLVIAATHNSTFLPRLSAMKVDVKTDTINKIIEKIKNQYAIRKKLFMYPGKNSMKGTKFSINDAPVYYYTGPLDEKSFCLDGNGLCGTGIIFFNYGDIYEGQLTENQMTGLGKYTYKNGDIYEGELLNGKKHGKGKYTYKKNGLAYEGEWANDKQLAQGIYIDTKSGDTGAEKSKNNKIAEEKKSVTRQNMVIKSNFLNSDQLNLKSNCTTEQVQGLLSFIDHVQTLVNKKQVTTSSFDPNKRNQAMLDLVERFKKIDALAFLSHSSDKEIQDFLLKLVIAATHNSMFLPRLSAMKVDVKTDTINKIIEKIKSQYAIRKKIRIWISPEDYNICRHSEVKYTGPLNENGDAHGKGEIVFINGDVYKNLIFTGGWTKENRVLNKPDATESLFMSLFK
jgi:hypothetical protein